MARRRAARAGQPGFSFSRGVGGPQIRRALRGGPQDRDIGAGLGRDNIGRRTVAASPPLKTDRASGKVMLALGSGLKMSDGKLIPSVGETVQVKGGKLEVVPADRVVDIAADATATTINAKINEILSVLRKAGYVVS